jgi:hypothetical protein
LEKVALKKSVLVKETNTERALVLDPSTDRIFQASQDMAKVVVMLFNDRKGRGVALSEIQLKLAAASPDFRKYKHQREGLLQVLQQLEKSDLLEIQS